MLKLKKSDLFFILYILYIINQVLSETQFINYSSINTILTLTRYVLVAGFAFCILIGNTSSAKSNIIIFFIFLLSTLMSLLLFDGGISILAIILISISSKGCSLKKLLSSTIVTLTIVHLFVLFSAKVGIVKDEVNVRYIGDYMGDFFAGQYIRHSMGFLVHNQVPLCFFIVYLLLVILKKDELKLRDNIFIFILNYIIYKNFGSRIIFVLVILTLIVYYLIKSKRKKLVGFLSNINSSLGLLLYPICALLSFILVYGYNGGKLSSYLDIFFNNRLSLAHRAIKDKGFSIFGYGKDAGIYTATSDYTVDNGYVLCMIQLGIVAFIIIIGIWSFLTKYSLQIKNYYLLLALFMLAIENIINAHLYSYKMLVFYCVLFNLKDTFFINDNESVEIEVNNNA